MSAAEVPKSATEVAARIAELARMLDGTDITALTLGTPAETLTLHRHADGAVLTPALAAASALVPSGSQAEAPGLVAVRATGTGVFLSRHPLRDAPLARVGQAVDAGEVLGLLRAGPLLQHVVAPRSGTVAAVVAEEGALVGYGTVLVQLATEGGE